MNQKYLIGVNLLHVVPGEVGGSEEYSVQVLSAFEENEQVEVEAVLYVLESFAEAHSDLCEKFETVICKIRGKNRLQRIIAESTWLKLKTRKCDAVHHFGGRLPYFSNSISAVTIHDLQPLEIPKNFSFIKQIFFKRSLPFTAKNSQILVSISQSVVNKLAERFDLKPENLSTVSIGVKKVAKEPSRAGKPLTIFYPAATYPHKNHQVLIAAFEKIAQKHGDIRLVMSGASGKADSQIRKIIATSQMKDRIFLTGRLPESELQELLKSSLLLAFPSTYEGFGIPVLEAMAAGVAVLVAEGTPASLLPGPKTIRLDPHDVEAWSNSIDLMLRDENLRKEIVQENLKYASTYTWEDSAAQLLNTWRKLINDRKE